MQRIILAFKGGMTEYLALPTRVTTHCELGMVCMQWSSRDLLIRFRASESHLRRAAVPSFY